MNSNAFLLLQRRSLWYGITAVFVASLCFLILIPVFGQILAVRWFVLTLVGLVFLFAFLWKNLDKNHQSPHADLLPSFGYGNSLTIFRGVLLAGVGGFLAAPKPSGVAAWIPGLVFLTAISADYIDGYLARRQGLVTTFGEWLDIQLDGAGILIGVLLAIHYVQVPIWYLPVGSARYLFLAGLWYRSRLGKEIVNLPESSRRRGLAGAQMVFLGVLLLPIFRPPATSYAAVVFMGVFLAGFLYDWYLTTGGRDLSVPLISEWRLRGLERAIPFVLRFSVAAILVAISISRLDLPGLRVFWGLLSPTQMPSPREIPLVELIGLFLAVFLVLGFAGRLTALLILILTGLTQIDAPLEPIQYLLILFTSLVFFTGTGPFSLWSPEGWVASHRAGRLNKFQGQR